MSRRDALKRGGAVVATVVLPLRQVERLLAQPGPREISIRSTYVRGQWFYDPVGLYIRKGETVRWLATKWGPTVTAFHPANDNHELRIPATARPFDSGLLGEDSDKYNSFEWTFEEEGTYDYYSRNHEPLGLVGRIVVGVPGGPAEDHAPGYGGAEGRAPVFPAQARLLNAVRSTEIVSRQVVPYPPDVVFRSFPYSGR